MRSPLGLSLRMRMIPITRRGRRWRGPPAQLDELARLYICVTIINSADSTKLSGAWRSVKIVKHSDNESGGSCQRDLSRLIKTTLTRPMDDMLYKKIAVINDKISCLRKRNKRKKRPRRSNRKASAPNWAHGRVVKERKILLNGDIKCLHLLMPSPPCLR